MLLTVQENPHLFFPRQIALLSTKQEGLDQSCQYILVHSEGQKKYFKYALHPHVQPNSIILPAFATQVFHQSISCCLLKSLDDNFEHQDLVTLSPVNANLVDSDAVECRVDGKIVTFNDDVISIKHKNDVIICKVRQAGKETPFIIDDQTKVLLETDKQATSFLTPYLNCVEYNEFSKGLKESTLCIHVVRNVFFRLFPLYLEHLKELFYSVAVVDSYPHSMVDNVELIVFMFTDAISDDQDTLDVYRMAVKAIAGGSRVLFVADHPTPANVKSLLERERVSINQFDFSLIDDSTKQKIVKDAPKYSLNGVSMRGLFELTKDACRLVDLQRSAWCLAGEVVDPTSVSWSLVFGYEQQISLLRHSIYDYLDYKEQFKANRIGPPRGILLHGPSGCGKTLISRSLAADGRLPVLSLSIMSLFSKFFGETEEKLRAAFSHARLIKPCILLIDDVDIVAPKREACPLETSGVSQRLLTTLLTELDGVDGCAKEGVTVVACTNAKHLIDPAFLRPGRMDVCIEIGRPSAEDRRQIIHGLLNNPHPNSKLDVEQLVEMSNDYTCAQICSMFQKAGWRAASLNNNSVHISMKDFIE